MKSILMYNCDYSTLFQDKDINCLIIGKEKQHESLGFLLKYFGFMTNKKENKTYFEESMIVFDKFDDGSLDEALSLLKGKGIKAITTKNNIGWSGYKLYLELAKEREFISKQEKEN